LFSRKKRNKQPLLVLPFSSRASSLLSPVVGMKILTEVVFLQNKQPPPKKTTGIIDDGGRKAEGGEQVAEGRKLGLRHLG
jgi:hypothetical protein